MANKKNIECVEATGMSINAARKFLASDAACARKLWDYRAAGHKIDAARAIVARIVPARLGDAGHNKTRINAQWAAADKQRTGPNLSVIKHIAAVRDGQSWLDRHQSTVDSIASINAALGGYPATGKAVVAIAGGQWLEIVRNMYVTWTDKKHWPTSTSTDYTARVRDSRGREIKSIKFQSRTGDWMGKMAHELGLPTGKKTAVTLSAAVTVRSSRKISGVELHALDMFGAPIGWCAVKSGETYHAQTAHEAISGLAKKISKAAGTVRASDVLTRSDARAMGFCAAGIAQFCAEIGLPDAQRATVRELRGRITPDIANTFGPELRKIGVLA